MNVYSEASNANMLFLGIDGGGSKCKAKLVTNDGRVLGAGLSGRANPVHGIDRTIESISNSSLAALEDAGLAEERISDVVAGVGLAGVNLPSLYAQVDSWSHPFKKMFLTTDLHIACLGAHAYQDGSAIITGTGSCGIFIKDGHTQIYGAHGFPIGDQCSGAWIGLKAISATLLAAEELGPQTTLTHTICEKLGVNPFQIAEKMLAQAPREYAKLAPSVFTAANQGDSVAVSIITEGADYVNRLANKILNENPGRLCLIGGLRSELFRWLSEDVQASLSDPIHQPEDGAIHYAKNQLGSNCLKVS